jgi:hypothetical protein
MHLFKCSKVPGVILSREVARVVNAGNITDTLLFDPDVPPRV